jgi:hypothetical protein
VPCHAFAWERLTVDTAACATLEDVRRTVLAAIETLAEPGRGLVVRVMLTGSTDAHDELAAESAGFADLLRDDLLGHPGPVWLDRLDDRTARRHDAASLAHDTTLPGDIVRSAQSILDDPASTTALVEGIVSPLLGSVPGLTPEDRGTIDAADVVTRARDLALDRLVPPGDR